MAVSIRLSRGGSKKRPYYRIVVADARSPRDGNFIEKVGTYNPMLAKDDANRISLNAERLTHWLSVGAQPTDRVARFLDAAGLRERAARNNPNKGKPGEKAIERLEEQTKKAEEAAEAAAAAAAAPAPEPEPEVVEETPVAEEAAPEAVAEEAAPEVVAEEAAPEVVAEDVAPVEAQAEEAQPEAAEAEAAPVEAQAEEAPAEEAQAESAEEEQQPEA